MPKHFSQEEKKFIKEELIEKGRDLIGRFGFKKTTISDLTKEVGIAKGSFYQFFNSKEELFFTVFEKEGEKLRNKIKEEILNKSQDSAQGLRDLIKIILKTIDQNPIINRIYDTEKLKLSFCKLKDEQLAHHRELSVDYLLPIINQWKDQGKIKKIDSELIIGLIRAISFITLHQEEIGEEIYSDVMELLIDLVVQGLTFDN